MFLGLGRSDDEGELAALDSALDRVPNRLLDLEARGERRADADGRTERRLLAALVASGVGALDDTHTVWLTKVMLSGAE